MRYCARLVSWYSSTSTCVQSVRYQRERLGHRLEQPHHAEQQVVEVDARPPPAAAPRRAGRARRCAPRGACARAAPRPRRRQHLVLGVADAVHHGGGRQRALVEVELAQRLLHQALPVVLVVDHEGRREPGLGRALAQDAHARRVEGGDERRPDARGQQQVLHPLAHLRGGLVGEGHREDVPRVDALDASR